MKILATLNRAAAGVALLLALLPAARAQETRAQETRAQETRVPEQGLRSLPRADGRATPIRVYGPQAGCPRTIVFSHGLGGGVERRSALLEALAAKGWRVIAVEHAESGPGQLRGVFASGAPRDFLVARAGDPERHRARFLDLDAAVAEAGRACRPPQLILMGHSMGAATTMIEAGARPRFEVRGRDRFDAYVALSPQGVGYLYAEGAWRGVTKPVLMVTGTRDEGADGDWRTRLSAFEGLPPGRKRLAVLPGANHFQLGGMAGQPAATIASLVEAFAAGVAQGRLPASTTPNVEVRDR